MPKMIADARERLLQAARESLRANGYKALSVREIARACKIGTGTVYNYFHSKDELLALVILEDWRGTLEKMDEDFPLAASFSQGMKSLYHELEAFVALYSPTWGEYTGAGGSFGIIAQYHVKLRRQIGEKIEKLALQTGYTKALLCADLWAETLLAAVLQPDLSFAQFEAMLALLT